MSLTDAMSLPSPTESSRRQATLGCLLGGITTIAAAAFSGALASGGHVAASLYRAPLSHDDFIVTSLLAAITHLIVLTGILALRRSRAAGAGPRVAAGLLTVAVGLVGLTILELVDLLLVDTRDAAAGAVVVGSAFAVATLVTIAGLVVAGLESRSARALPGWRANALLLCAIASLGVLPFAFAGAVWPGVICLGAGYLILGAALQTRQVLPPGGRW